MRAERATIESRSATRKFPLDCHVSLFAQVDRLLAGEVDPPAVCERPDRRRHGRADRAAAGDRVRNQFDSQERGRRCRRVAPSDGPLHGGDCRVLDLRLGRQPRADRRPNRRLRRDRQFDRRGTRLCWAGHRHDHGRRNHHSDGRVPLRRPDQVHPVSGDDRFHLRHCGDHLLAADQGFLRPADERATVRLRRQVAARISRILEVGPRRRWPSASVRWRPFWCCGGLRPACRA